ncbi:MAG: hypothetical protein LRS43_01805, partial [Desulfurococcales archaeon]|nr:hypothetical protein [Desulfurococcales archaeon]
MNASQCDKELVERLSELAKIGVDPAETEKLCGDLQRIASYLGSLGGLSNELRGVEPLYHVWEELGV